MKFSENLAERLLEALLKGFYPIAISDGIWCESSGTRGVFTPGVLSRVNNNKAISLPRVNL